MSSTGQGDSHGTKTVMHFEVHPSVLFKLGQDLITDDAQALTELVKNSYDADARRVKVIIDTLHWYSRLTGERVGGKNDPDAVLGMLQVVDDGSGMSVDDIRNGWLTVSYSHKREMKERGEKTGGKRVPLGDKGLGRLGVQRLGQVLMLESVPAMSLPTPPPFDEDSSQGVNLGNESHALMIDWERYATARSLGAVNLEVVSTAIDESPTRTAVTVLGLSSPGYWASTDTFALQRDLTAVISPYAAAEGLAVSVVQNGTPIDIRGEAERVLASAQWVMSFDYRDDTLRIRSAMRHSRLSGGDGDARAAYRALIAPDGGFAFANHLLETQSKRAAERGLTLGDDEFFLRFETSIPLAEAIPSGVDAEDPGPFHGEISSFSLDQAAENESRDPELNLSDLNATKSELRKFAQLLTGIRVYRDGFGIRLDPDWLGLSSQQTSGSSFYGLRPNNTAGFVNLTVAHNASLEETSSREAFRDTPAWRGFHGLMHKVTHEARLCMDLVRREWVEYRREVLTPTVLPESSTPTEIVAHIDRQLVEANQARSATERARETVKRLSKTVASLESSRVESGLSVWPDAKLQEAVAGAATEIAHTERELASTLAEVDHVLSILAEITGSAALLQSKLDVAEKRLADAWEFVAVGLSAELLAHEADQIADRLRGRSYQITEYLKSKEPKDKRVLAFAEHVRATAGELLRQVARLNPSLRFRRDRKSINDTSSMVNAIVEYHTGRLSDENIRIVVETRHDFRIKYNIGKLTQILDNLIRNGEYWLRRQRAQGAIEKGEIHVVIDAPRIVVSDTGPGISPAVLDSLFDAFVTTKPGREGRGLGLFVARQLVESEGGTIQLANTGSASRTPPTFEIDLRASLTSDEVGEVVD